MVGAACWRSAAHASTGARSRPLGPCKQLQNTWQVLNCFVGHPLVLVGEAWATMLTAKLHLCGAAVCICLACLVGVVCPVCMSYKVLMTCVVWRSMAGCIRLYVCLCPCVARPGQGITHGCMHSCTPLHGCDQLATVLDMGFGGPVMCVEALMRAVFVAPLSVFVLVCWCVQMHRWTCVGAEHCTACMCQLGWDSDSVITPSHWLKLSSSRRSLCDLDMTAHAPARHLYRDRLCTACGAHWVEFATACQSGVFQCDGGCGVVIE
jgi:hypothetical protein